MQPMVSKSQFKAQALQFLREVEKKKQPLIITHGGKPVAKIVPYGKENALASLRNSVISYKDPTKPVDECWEALQ